jgi:hypothetical protein
MTEMSFMENQCFLKERDSNACGVSRGVKEFVFVSDCNDDIRRHLTSFRLSKSNINECDLILARVGVFCASQKEKEQLLVCPYHRYKFGKFWRPSKVTCQYPTHKGKSKTLKGVDVVTLQMAKDIHAVYGSVIPIGSRKYAVSNLLDSTFIRSSMEVSTGNSLFYLYILFAAICSTCRKSHKSFFEAANKEAIETFTEKRRKPKR